MVGKNLISKLKIAALVLAALIVVGSVVAYGTLSTLDSSSQNGLNSALDNGVAVLSSDVGVTITSGSVEWSTDKASAPSIGTYTLEGTGSVPKKFTSTVEGFDEHNVQVRVSGKTFSGEDIEIDEYVGSDGTINLGKAGEYSATVTLYDEDDSSYNTPIAEQTFYAKISKYQIQEANGLKFNNSVVNASTGLTLTYTGTERYGQIVNLDANVLWASVEYKVDGYYFLADGETERVKIQDDRIGHSGGQFSLTDAGDYTVSVGIKDKDNYEWSSALEAQAIDGYITLGPIKIQQKNLSGSITPAPTLYWEIPDPGVDYNPNLTEDKLAQKVSVSIFTNQGSESSFYGKLAYYTSDSYSESTRIKNNEFEVGTVYVQVVSFLQGEDQNFRNYTLTLNGARISRFRSSFSILAPKVSKPALSTWDFRTGGKYKVENPTLFNEGHFEDPQIDYEFIVATYQGFDYHFSQFIDDWETYPDGALNITIDGLQGNDPAMRNVLTSGEEKIFWGNAFLGEKFFAHKITVSLAEHYVWDDGSDDTLTYYFAIAPKTLWDNITFDMSEKYVYSGNSYDFTEKASVEGLYGSDSLDLIFDIEGRTPIYHEIRDEHGQLIDTEIVGYEDPTRAGTYTVKVTGISGDDSINYKMPSNNPLGMFTIYRQRLVLPTEPVVSGVFNGAEQVFSLVEIMEGIGLVRYNESNDPEHTSPLPGAQPRGTVCQAWDGSTISNHGASVFLNGNFTVTHAGRYSITFEMINETLLNYCWPGESDSPHNSSEDAYQYVWTNFAVIERAEIPTLSTEQQHISIADEYVDMALLLTGKLGDSTAAVYRIVEFGQNKVGGITSANQQDIDYDSATGKHLEGDYYVLLEILDGFEKSCYFVEGDGVEINGNRAKVFYSVSSNLASVTVSGSGYTFGANMGTSGVTVNTVFSVTSNKDISNTQFKFFNDEHCEQEVAASNLVNGLPRNAGTYYAQVTVTFTDSEIAPREVVKAFTVSQRELTVIWKLDDVQVDGSVKTVTFDKSTHTVTASVTPLSGAANVSVTVANASGLVNVGTYTFNNASLSLSGTDSANYTLATASFTLNITHRVITVSAPQLENLTYGELLNESLLIPTGTNSFLTGDYNNEISIFVYNQNGVRVTDFTKALSKGTYTLIPVWNGGAPETIGNYTTEQGNYSLSMTTTSFTIVSQTLVVTLTNASSIYGDSVDVYNAVAEVSGLTSGDYKDYIVITLKKNETAVSLEQLAAGTYDISVALKATDGDYALSVVNDAATYEVTKRDIKVRAADVTHKFGESSLTVNGAKILLQDGYTLAEWEQSEDLTKLLGLTVNHYVKKGTSQYDIFTDRAKQEVGVYAYHIKKSVTANPNPNYNILEMADGAFTIVPRTLTISFTDDGGSSVYGDSIDLYKQPSGVASDNNSNYIVCTVSGLRFASGRHFLGDAATLTLVGKDGTEYNVATTVVPAGEYQVKITTTKNYNIQSGSDVVTSITGGKYVVSPAQLTLEITANKTSITYGATLTEAGITFGSSLINGSLIGSDVLGESVVIYNSSNEVVADISQADAASNYYLALDWTNKNYDVTCAHVPFEVTKRAITITPKAVLDHIYGTAIGDTFNANDAYALSDQPKNGNNLGISLAVYANAASSTPLDVSALNVGEYVIKPGYTANANYEITPATAMFKVIPRNIEITALSVDKHIYGEGLGENELKYEITSELKLVGTDNLGIMPVIYRDGAPVPASDVATLPVDSYIIIITHTENGNYSVSTVNGIFHVVQRKVEITFKSGAQSVYGESVDLSAAYDLDGLIEGDESRMTVTATKGSYNATDSKAPVGTYVVTITFDGSYEVVYTNPDQTTGTYEITPRNIKITANALTHTYGDAIGSKLTASSAYTVTALGTYTGSAILEGDNLNIRLVVMNGSAVADNAIAALNVNAYALKVSYDTENANYSVTTDETAKFTINKRELTLTFTANGGSSVYGNTIDLYSAAVGSLTNAANGHTYNALVDLALTKNSAAVTGTPSFGNYEVAATLNSGYTNNYTLKVVNTGKYSVTARTVVLAVSANFTNVVYGNSLVDNPFGYTMANGTSFVSNDDAQALNITYRVYVGNNSGNLINNISTQNVGTYNVDIVIGSASDNYTVQTQPATFEIVKRQITLTFTTGGGTSVYGEAIDLYSSTVGSLAENDLANGAKYNQVVTLAATLGGSTMAERNNGVGNYIVTATIANSNYTFAGNSTVSPTTGKYAITTRNIVVTPNNVSNVYGDAIGNKLDNAYTVTSGSSYTGTPIVSGDDLGITLSVYNGANKVNANDIKTLAVNGTYVIKVSYTENANYSVDTSATASFTVTKRDLNVEFVNDKFSVYGDELTSDLLKTLYTETGLVTGDEITVTAIQGANSLLDTNAPAGIYTVTVGASNNYDINYVNGVSGSYLVKPRTISVAINNASVTYTEDVVDGKVNYHNGEYGAEHNATFSFTNAISALTGTDYTVKYNTEGNGSWQTAEAAPRAVGNYTVTVTLTNTNYVFENGTSAQFSFAVTQKVLDVDALVWNTDQMKYDSAGQVNIVAGFIDAIMDVESFTKTTAGDGHAFNPPTDIGTVATPEEPGYYYINDDGQLCVSVVGRAKYDVTIVIADSAQRNYTIEYGPIVATFYVVNFDKVELEIKTVSWQYGEIPVVDEVGGNIYAIVNDDDTYYGFEYSYALVHANANLTALLARKAESGFKGFDADDVADLYDNLIDFPAKMAHGTFEVGYYVIRVAYNGIVSVGGEMDIVNLEKFDIVEVTKKQLSIPLTIESVTFNGADQTASVSFNMVDNGQDVDISELLIATFNSDILTSANKYEIYGKNATTYKVIVKIDDTAHYVWADAMNAENGEVTVTWTIERDSADNATGKYFTINTIASTTYGVSPTISQSNLTINAHSGYGRAFTWYFAAKGAFANAADEGIVWTEWTSTSRPVNAGEYFVKVVLSDGNKNYTDKIAYGSVTINKATLHIVLSGTMTYGNKFAQSDCSWKVVESDLLYGDSASVVKGNVSRYKLVKTENGDDLVYEGNLIVGSYSLSAIVDVNNYVHGLSADNYYIVLSDDYGTFKVTPLTITVTIGNASGQYGLTPNLTGVEVTYTGTVDTQLVIDGVKAALKTVADNTSVVRAETYEIYSEYKNDNFGIKWTNGGYTVTAREIVVTLDGSNAGGTFGGTVGTVTVATIKDTNGQDVSALVNGFNYLTVVFNGTAFDGSAYDGNKHAGNFSATVIGDAANANFTISSADTVSVVVAKQELDESKISIEADQKIYTGAAIEPTFNKEYVGLYTVVSHTPFVDVDKYVVQIQLVDANNYKWTTSTTDTVDFDFEIVGAVILAIPHATIVYGQTFADVTKYGYKLIYQDGRQPVADGVVTVEENFLQYFFVDDASYNASRPQAGTYALAIEKLSANSDFVKGFTSKNYVIALEAGEFVVKQLAIEITVDDSSSTYSESITLNNGFTITKGELISAWGDDESVITMTITADPSIWSDADPYTVTATATAANYVITVKDGRHTINPLDVTITITTENGMYIDQEAEVNTKATASLAYEFEANFFTKYTFKYTDESGAEYAAKPTNAGSYTVTVTAINDKNFNLVSSDIVSFTIAKKEIDQNAIAVREDAVYNGEEQSHGIADVANEYTVSNGAYRDADKYDVFLTLVDPANYTWKGTTDATVTKQFVIDKATLTITPSGEITYGDMFRQGACSFAFDTDGFFGGDNKSVVKGHPTFMLGGGLENTNLAVREGGYTLIVAISDSDGFVEGLTAKNYNIKATNGIFTVKKRPITIQPVASSSVYSQPVEISQEFTVIGNFAFDDDISAIRYLATLADDSVSVGAHDLTVEWESANYEVRVLHGTHTIEPIKVAVDIRAINGVYGNSNKVASIEIMSAVLTNVGTVRPAPELQYVIRYVGDTNSGSHYNSTRVPVQAGMYRARVESIENNANYVIDETYGTIFSTMLMIEKQELDLSKITVKPATYSGAALVPTVSSVEYVNGSNIYELIYDGQFIEAGEYDVTIRITDPYNYCWSHISGYAATVKFEIVKADNKLVDSAGSSMGNIKIEIGDWTFGNDGIKPSANVLNGAKEDIVFEYSTSEHGDYTKEVPTDVGTYWVRATVAESKNYNAFVSNAVSFTISKRIVAVPSLAKVTEGNNRNDAYTGALLYSSIENFDETVMRLNYDGMCRINNGTATLAALDAGTYTATLTLIDSKNYAWEDSSQVVDGKVVVTWTITRKVISVLPNATNKIMVNGEDVVFIPEGFDAGIMEISGNVRAHKGNYTAVVTLKDTTNYVWEGTDSNSITVDFELTGTNTAFVAAISVVSGLCVGLGVMALILTLVFRSKKRKQEADIDRRSREDGWNE